TGPTQLTSSRALDRNPHSKSSLGLFGSEFSRTSTHSSERCPGRIAARGFEHGGDEAHSFDPRLDAGNEQRLRTWLAAFAMSLDLIGQIGIELGKAFKIALGMTGRHAAGAPGSLCRAGPTTADQPRWLAIG